MSLHLSTCRLSSIHTNVSLLCQLRGPKAVAPPPAVNTPSTLSSVSNAILRSEVSGVLKEMVGYRTGTGREAGACRGA